MSLFLNDDIFRVINDSFNEVLESFVTKRRDKKAALKFLRKSLRLHGPTETIVTDGTVRAKSACR